MGRYDEKPSLTSLRCEITLAFFPCFAVAAEMKLRMGPGPSYIRLGTVAPAVPVMPGQNARKTETPDSQNVDYMRLSNLTLISHLCLEVLGKFESNVRSDKFEMLRSQRII